MSVMVLGTASHVGKSTIVAAICRVLANRGVQAAPFKAQNMSLNSWVTRDGGEIGIAQAVQAWAARLEPEVAMNPILLKPKGDATSQVVLMGRPYKDVPIREYYQETPFLLETAVAAARSLIGRYGHIVTEGAGGAAEVNLYPRDIPNTLMAKELGHPVVLVADIERGGVFAQVVGTLVLLPPEVRQMVIGVIVNKFCGDPDLFAGGVRDLERLTGVPVLGVLPVADVGLPSEDSLSLADKNPGASPIRIAVLRLPRISNFTDFELLERGASVVYVTPGEPLGEYDAVIIPGTKNTTGDLDVIRSSGADRQILAARGAGVPVIGICGGYQILGRRISDSGIESAKGEYEGLGLLDVTTRFDQYAKMTRQVRRRSSRVPPILSRIEEVTGYEIHMGETVRGGDREAFDGDGAVSADGLVIGTYLHGLFHDPGVVAAFLGFLSARRGLVPGEQGGNPPEDLYDRLADLFAAHIHMDPVLACFRTEDS